MSAAPEISRYGIWKVNIYFFLIGFLAIAIAGYILVSHQAHQCAREDRERAEARQREQEARERRMQLVITSLAGDPNRESSRQVTIIGDYINATLKNGASKEELNTSLEIAKLCKGGRLSLPSCGSLTWSDGPEIELARAAGKAPLYRHFSQQGNGTPPPEPQTADQEPKAWHRQS